MGDAFVDVTYRGLEVGRRLRIRQFTREAAYVEAPTPMPVGTSLEIATDAGVRIAAVVARVHEQVGGSDRPPGMRVVPTLDDQARAWWEVGVATWPEDLPSSAEVTRPMRVTQPPIARPADGETRPALGAPTEVISQAIAHEATTRPIEPIRAGGLVEIVEDVEPAPTAPYAAPVPVADVPVAVAVVSDATAPASAESGAVVVDDDTGHSQRMPMIDDGARTQVMATVVPPPDDELPDQGKRTTVMAAVDLEAILASEAASSDGDDDEPEIEVASAPEDAGRSGAMPAAATKGKKKAATGKRNKRRK